MKCALFWFLALVAIKSIDKLIALAFDWDPATPETHLLLALTALVIAMYKGAV